MCLYVFGIIVILLQLCSSKEFCGNNKETTTANLCLGGGSHKEKYF
jgi:hypothetical protein